MLLSWALPKGPSFDPADKRTAIEVEDHPLSYGGFEGTIPAKQYGAGTVIVWDRGAWESVGDPREGKDKGKILFKLHGEKLAGLWELVRISRPRDKKQDHWILFQKRGDAWARPRAEYHVVAALPDSVIAKPLGPVEERDPRAAAAATSAAAGRARPFGGGQGHTAGKAGAPAGYLVFGSTHRARMDRRHQVRRLPHHGQIAAGEARLITRGGHDWTDRMPALANAIEAIGIRSGWIDGEIVVMNDAGVPDFNALQNAFETSHSEAIQYFVFDAQFLNGIDLRRVPLWSRRAVLQAAFAGSDSDLVQVRSGLQPVFRFPPGKQTPWHEYIPPPAVCWLRRRSTPGGIAVAGTRRLDRHQYMLGDHQQALRFNAKGLQLGLESRHWGIA